MPKKLLLAIVLTLAPLAMSAAEHLIVAKSGATSTDLVEKSIRDLKGRLN